MPRMKPIHVKRAYDPPSHRDGVRILVDRLWPRGLSRTEAHVDVWVKEVAPSSHLRRWFNHDPLKWTEFRRRYAEELDSKKGAIAALIGAVRRGRVTLLFGSKDQRHNNAVALQAYLASRRGQTV
jgi:uncharacterized protein YeaO (DUF488 family)